MPDQPLVANPLEIRCTDAVELVTAYLDDALDAADLERFVAHLDVCDGCAVFVDQIRMTVTLSELSGEDEVEVLPQNFEELVAMLRERASTPPS